MLGHCSVDAQVNPEEAIHFYWQYDSHSPIKEVKKHFIFIGNVTCDYPINLIGKLTSDSPMNQA